MLLLYCPNSTEASQLGGHPLLQITS
jgi:hypothetical protein